MYDVHAKTVPSNLDNFVKILKKHHYHPRLSTNKTFSIKYSRIEEYGENRLPLESTCLIGI